MGLLICANLSTATISYRKQCAWPRRRPQHSAAAAAGYGDEHQTSMQLNVTASDDMANWAVSMLYMLSGPRAAVGDLS